MSADDEPTRREVAVRVFAREFEDATLSYSESDEERAPTYVALPTGARANRVFVVGVLTAVGSVSDDVLRGRIADPTGAFVCYAGQYQPEAQRFLERTDPPAFVALTGKARTFEPDDGDAIYSSIRPETITTVDDDTRDRWVVQTAAATLDRCRIASDALDSDRSDAALTEWLRARGVDRTLAAGLPKAIDHYGLGRGYLSATAEMAIQTLGVVAGQRDAVDDHGLEPDTSGDRRTIPTIDTPLAIGGYTTPRQVFEATIEGASATTADSGDADTAESTASESETAGAETTASASAGAESSATESETVESAPDDTEREGTATDTGAVAVGTTGGSATTADDAAADSTGSSGTSDSTDDAIDSTGSSGTSDSTDDAIDSTDDVDDSAGSASESTDDSTGAASTTDRSAGASKTSADETVASTTDESDTASDPGEFDLDEETRESIESEYGTEFSTGTEVDEPGEADIETPDPEIGDDATGADSTGAERSQEDSTGEASTETVEDSGPTATTDTEEAPAGDDEAAEPPVDTGAAEEAADDGVSEEAPADDGASDESSAETAPTDTAGDETGDSSVEDTGAVDLDTAVLDAMVDRDEGDGVDRETLVESVAESAGVDRDAVEGAIDDALMSGRCYEPTEGTLKPI